MEHLRRAAQESVLQACGFASLAIFCVMIGLSFDPYAAFKAGGILTTVMVIVLIMKAYEALNKDHRKTEMWLCLPKDLRPPESYAQKVSAPPSCTKPTSPSQNGLRRLPSCCGC
jgi:hypothetical protein